MKTRKNTLGLWGILHILCQIQKFLSTLMYPYSPQTSEEQVLALYLYFCKVLDPRP